MAESSVLPPFRVLALDGGGIRGLYTATLLDLLSEYFAPKSEEQGSDKLGKKFNLIAGTSTGGILAMGLAAGIPLRTIISLYIKAGEAIFPQKNHLPSNKIRGCPR